jgi:Cys-tRNA(Pro)/Cys-tRNA(Cys) deacylase
MTPAINYAKQRGVAHRVHEYAHDPDNTAYGTEAAEKLGLAQSQVFKTLVVSLDGKELVVAVVPVAVQLSLKQLAKAAGAKKAAMADKGLVERTTGYVLGGVSPLGQKKRLRTFIDASAEGQASLFVSAGRRGLEIELAPADLKTLTGGQFVAIAQ